MTKTKAKTLISIIVVAAALFPFDTTLVPEWTLRVVDENGSPYRRQGLRQFCTSYTLGISPCYDSNDFVRETDESGYATFPSRKINASFLSRAIRTIFSFVMQIAHGSFGVDIYIDTTGPEGYKTLKYVPGETIPTELILPSAKTEKEN